MTKVTRILYKEIRGADLLKVRAISNTSPTGGGARDFRFGSYNKLLPAITLMFPNAAKEQRKRDGVMTTIDVLQGVFRWKNPAGGMPVEKESFFEPPNDVRRTEGRIARVHEYGCFAPSLVPSSEGGRILLLLIQHDDGSVWPHYVSEASIRKPRVWAKTVADRIIACLDAKRPTTRSVIGFFDFTTTSKTPGYCDGK